MVVSGLIVAPAADRREEVRVAIDALPWAEIHYEDGEGRWVVTVEAANTDEAMNRNQELQKLPGVVMAEMAEHFVGDENANTPPPAGDGGLRAQQIDGWVKPETEN